MICLSRFKVLYAYTSVVLSLFQTPFLCHRFLKKMNLDRKMWINDDLSKREILEKKAIRNNYEAYVYQVL